MASWSEIAAENPDTIDQVIIRKITYVPDSKKCVTTSEMKLAMAEGFCTKDLTKYYEQLKVLSEKQVISLQEVEANPDVALSDQNTELGMFCYTRDTDMDTVDSFTGECRGIVFDKYEHLVSKAFGYTPQYSIDEVPSDIKEFIIEHFDYCKFFPAWEGALVRAFYHKDKWYLTTHRKLDAYKSYWGCRTSFGQMFQNALVALQSNPEFKFRSENPVPEFLESLDKSKQYVFLLVATMENRIVCNPPETPTVLHVGTFQNNVMIPSESTGVPLQTPLTVSNFEEVVSFIQSIQNDNIHQGVVVFMPNGKQIKLCSALYLEYFNLRGNESSVMFRYLQLRGDPIRSQRFRDMYQEHVYRFDQYETILKQISESIYHSYCERFISRKRIVVPKEEFSIMSAIHSSYKNKRSSNVKEKIQLSDVTEYLLSVEPTALNAMIRRYNEKIRNLEKAELAAQ